MGCIIHYKFKAFLEYKTLTFVNQNHINLDELQKAILHNEHFENPNTFNLELTNSQTKKLYTNKNELIPNNSSITVVRIPL
jgi:hypothetical protein